MIKGFSTEKIVLATHNPGKLREMQDIMRPKAIEIVSAGALCLPEPDETGVTFEENAALKALAAAKASGLPALADDSGLTVAALNGAPGVYSARWGGPNKDFDMAMRRVQNELAAQNENRDAAFVCVMALALPDGAVEMRRGECAGIILPEQQGRGGFGYDPIFAPISQKGRIRSFAQMSSEEKRALSHRGLAMQLMLDEVFA